MTFTQAHHATVNAACRWQRIKGPLPHLADLAAAITALGIQVDPKSVAMMRLTPTNRRRVLAQSLVCHEGLARSKAHAAGLLGLAGLPKGQSIADAMEQPLVIHLEGGLVQGVAWDGPPMQVVIHDYDIENADPADLGRDAQGRPCHERRLATHRPSR